MKRIKSIEKKLRQTCPVCKAVYQLLENHFTPKSNEQCLNNCLQKWNNLLYEYHQEKVLAHITQQEQKANDLADKLAETWRNKEEEND